MPHQKLIARLQGETGISPDDRAQLERLPHIVKTFRKGETVAKVGEKLLNCCVVMSGILYRQRIVAGRNQVTSFYVSGDMPDLQSLHLPVVDRELCSLGASKVALISHSLLKRVLANSAALTHAFWRETVIQAEIHRDWVDNLGSRNALAKVAHLFCEMACRLETVGLCSNASFRAPFTQPIIAQACGLSVVHTNRIVQEMRRLGLIEWRGHQIELLRRHKLEELAEFDPSYLRLLKLPKQPTLRSNPSSLGPNNLNSV